MGQLERLSGFIAYKHLQEALVNGMLLSQGREGKKKRSVNRQRDLALRRSQMTSEKEGD